jgi:hypothetical protein
LLGEFTGMEGMVASDDEKTSAPMPGQPLYYNDTIRLFTTSGYVKTDTETSGGGGHVGVYKSARAQRKYNAFLFAIPPIGARAEFDFETTTFVVLKPGTVWSGKGGTGGTGNEDIATHDVTAHSGGR